MSNQGRETGRPFYTSRAWTRKRAAILERDHYECQMCKAAGGYSRGVVVHHIKHLDARPDLALVDDNLITVCEACHNALHPDKFGAQHEVAARRRARLPERW